MASPQDRPGRPGLFRRLFGASGGGDAADSAPRPLFRSRPVPPAEPKGPGMPAWDEILSAAPAIIDRERLPRPTAVPDLAPPTTARRPPMPPPTVVTATMPQTVATPADPGGGAPAMAGRRPLTESETAVLAQIGGLLAAGKVAEAAELVEARFRGVPDAADRNGRPVYLLESLRCALLLGRSDAAQGIAARLAPLLADGDPIIETLCARVALLSRNRAGARLAWQAALARAPNLAEARDWLARNPLSPDGGLSPIDLIAVRPGAERPLVGAAPPLAPPPQSPAALPNWMPGRLLTAAALFVDGDGGIVVGTDIAQARLVPRADDRDLAIVLRHPDGLEQPHPFTDVLLAAFVLQREFLPHLRPARLYAGCQRWAIPGGETGVHADMLAVLFPGLTVVGEFEGAVREANVLMVDGALRNPATGSVFGAMMPYLTRWHGEARARAFAAFDLPATAEPPREAGRKPRALYLQAPPPRTLAEPVRERLFALLDKAGYEVATVDPATLPWHRQVRLAHGADLIAGTHGPALNLLLWATPGTKALEFFPEGTRRYDGQLLAEAAGLAYLGLEGVAERGFVVRVRDRWGPPVGTANRLVWALPWTMLEQALAAPPVAVK